VSQNAAETTAAQLAANPAPEVTELTGLSSKALSERYSKSLLGVFGTP